MGLTQIASMIHAATLCSDCIADGVSVQRRDVDAPTPRIDARKKIADSVGRCDRCLKWTVVRRVS
jgi:hypothetical protein